MSRPTNQTIERCYFKLFASHYDMPAGAVVFTDKPDVIVRGERSIGIEIANLYVDSGADPASEQVQRVRRLQVLERAQALHHESGGRHIELSVDFDPKCPIRDIEPLARSLTAIATEVDHSPSGQVNPTLFAQVPELRFVYHNRKEYPDAKWRSVQCHSVPCLSLGRLRELISDKTKKLSAYQPCDAYWLLLVVDFMDSAQDQDLHWPPGEVLGSSPFERVLLYKPQFAEVLQVPQ
jgi:hypothetical protein